MNLIRTFLKIDDTGKIEKNKISIKTDTFSDKEKGIDLDADRSFANLLWNYYDSKPIEIKKAKANPLAEDDTIVTITGEADLFGVKNIPVEIIAFHDEQKSFGLFIKYEMDSSWKFTDSFPKVPTFISLSDLGGDRKYIYEDSKFKNRHFVFSTFAIEKDGVEINPGLNFLAHKPAGNFSLLKDIVGLGGKHEMADKPVFGTVNPNYSKKSVMPLTAGRQPWELPEPPVGICLSAINKKEPGKLGKLSYLVGGEKNYTPIDSEWMYDNDTFRPVTGYPATVTIPSAGDIPFKFNVLMPPGGKMIEFVSSFEDMRLEKLADLSDIISKKDYLKDLPDELKSIIKGIQGIQLQSLSFVFDYDKKRVDKASVTIGFYGVKWNVFDDLLELNNISLTINVKRPGTRTKFSVDLTAKTKIKGVEVNVYSSLDEHFILKAELANKETLPLNAFIKSFAPNVTTPGELTIDALSTTIVPGEKYNLSILMAQEINAWKVDLGPVNLEFSDVSLALDHVKGAGTTAKIKATTKIDKFKLTTELDLPGNFKVKGKLPKTTLSQLISSLTRTQFTFPDKFDLTFDQSSIIIAKKKDTYSVELGTTIQEMGKVAFVIQKGQSGWGFAAGVAIKKENFKSLKGVEGFVTTFNKYFPFESLILAVSSMKDQEFKFPSFSDFDDDNLPSDSIVLPQSVEGITKGFFIYANTRFDNGNEAVKALAKLLSIPEGTEVNLAIGYDASDNSFGCGIAISSYTSLSKLSHGEKAAEHPYKAGAIAGKLFAKAGKSGFNLTIEGDYKTIIQEQDVNFNVALTVETNGILLSGTMKNKEPLKFGNFQVADVALVLGMSFQMVPTIGLSGILIIKGLLKSNVALMIDANDPTNFMIAGSISDVTLAKVIKYISEAPGTPGSDEKSLWDKVAIRGPLAGKVYMEHTAANDAVTHLKNKEHEKLGKVVNRHYKNNPFPENNSGMVLYSGNDDENWYVTTTEDKAGADITPTHYQLKYDKGLNRVEVSRQAQIYIVPNPSGVRIGKIDYKSGIKVCGRLEIFFIDLEIDAEIVPQKGVRFFAEMKKIRLINDNIFSIKAQRGDGGPVLSFSSFNDPTADRAEFKEKHFYLNAKITLLSLSAEAFVNIRSTGAEFLFKVGLADTLTGTLKGHFTSLEDLSISGKLECKVDSFTIPVINKQININSKASIELGLKVTPNTAKGDPTISLYLTPAVTIDGRMLQIPTFSIDVRVSKITEFASMIFKAVKDFFGNLFGEGIEKLKTLAADGYKFAKEGLNEIAEIVNKALNDATSATTKVVKVGVDEAVKAYEWAIANGAGTIQDAAATVIQSRELQLAFQATVLAATGTKIVIDAAADGIRFIGDTADTVGSALGSAARDTGKFIDNTASDVGRAVGGAAKDVGQFAENRAKDVAGAAVDVGEATAKAAVAVYRFLKLW